MSGLMCCIWWFVFGVLVGWLLSWFLSKFMGGGDSGSSSNSSRPMPAYSPPAPPAPPAPTMDPRLAMIAAAAAAGIVVKGEDDLEIVEGIGPKIAALLKDAGINTFAKLGSTSIPTLSAILEKAGPRFKLANPGSWAQQSALAAGGKWVELKKLQDELVAGVRMSGEPDDSAT
jgi:predicted flap endonuclease-1-like 5' DNA nuclease